MQIDRFGSFEKLALVNLYESVNHNQQLFRRNRVDYHKTVLITALKTTARMEDLYFMSCLHLDVSDGGHYIFFELSLILHH